MTDEETKSIARIENKLDHLVSVVETQNTILSEHAQQLETFNRNLSLLNQVQQNHGTQIEHLLREVRHLQFSAEETSPDLTPIPTLAADLAYGEGD